MKSEAVPATLPRVTASFSLGHVGVTWLGAEELVDIGEH
jgi:hypothetical protein